MQPEILFIKQKTLLKPKVSRKRKALVHLAEALFVYSLFYIIAYISISSEYKLSYGLIMLHIGGAVALFTFWYRSGIGKEGYDNFGSALLIFGIIFRVHALIDTIIYGDRVYNISQYVNMPIANIDNSFLKGELISFIGLILVTVAWRYSVGSTYTRQSFTQQCENIPSNASLVTYILTVTTDVFRRITGVDYGPFTQLAGLLFLAGVASIYFLAIKRKTSTTRIATALLLSAPLSVLALESGMKSEIFLPLFPAAILIWNEYRRPVVRLILIIIGAVILTISQLYVQHVRTVAWTPLGILQIPTSDLVESFVQNFDIIDLKVGFDNTSSRVNMTASHATTVALADHYGLEPMDVFGLIPASFVPRILWPDKPIMQPGVMHTARVQGLNLPLSEIRSATASGFFTELYLGGWWIAVLLGTILYGMILGKMQRWALISTGAYGHKVICFVALYLSFRFDEQHVVYAYTSIFFLMVFIYIITRLYKILGIYRYQN